MTIPNELSIPPRARRKPVVTWTELADGLAATLPALGQAHLVISTKIGNRFVQFASDPEDGLRAETVGNEYLEPADRHTDAQVAELLALGWNEPTHASDAPNYFRDWEPPALPWDDIAQLAVKTLRTIGVAEPAALEYSAWDAEDRPLSLPALRLARRKEKAVRPSRRARKSKRAVEPRPVPPQVRRLRNELLAATRIFQANNAIQVDEDGDIPIRFGRASGCVQVFSNPLLVRVYCQVGHDLAVTDQLLRRLHELNAKWSLGRFILVGTSVFAAVDFTAEPFSVAHFTSACSVLQAIEREDGEELRALSDAGAKKAV
jgi:hypothetical protein